MVDDKIDVVADGEVDDTVDMVEVDMKVEILIEIPDRSTCLMKRRSLKKNYLMMKKSWMKSLNLKMKKSWRKSLNLRMK